MDTLSEKFRSATVLFIIVKGEFLHWIKDYKTLNETWDILETLFTKKNEAKLQQLENEVMSIKQEDMRVSQCFTKVKSLHDEIQKIDGKVWLLRLECGELLEEAWTPSIVALLWQLGTGQPSLVELESILANQEDLDKQISKISIKEEENALFTKRRAHQGQGEGVRRYNSIGESLGRRQPKWQQGYHGQGSSLGGGHWAWGQWKGKRYRHQEDRCYNYGKKGHFAKGYKSSHVEAHLTIAGIRLSPSSEFAYVASLKFYNAY